MLRFNLKPAGDLSVQLETSRLRLMSVTEQDEPGYQWLLSHPDTMRLYATGAPWEKERITTSVKRWSRRWREGDPFSSFVVRLKETDKMIGHIILTHGDKAGSGELAFVLHHDYWGKGYGREMVQAFIKEYIPELIQRGYQIQGEHLKVILATAVPENVASIKLLQSAGLHYQKQEFSYGHFKSVFFLPVSEIADKKNSQRDCDELENNLGLMTRDNFNKRM